MEKKKKEHKIASTISQEPKSNEILSKEGVALAAKSTRAGSPLHDTATSLNGQNHSIIQWPYTPQHNLEQPSSSSNPCAPTRSPQSVAVSQWHQLPHPQLNPINNQVQQGHPPPPHLAHPLTPFWLSQLLGYHLTGVNTPAIFQPFTPLGALDANWQVPAAIGGETLSKDNPQVPNSCYQVLHPYPRFSGPWDPSTWCDQARPAFTYAFPGAHGCFSSQPPMMPSCSASPGQSFKRGINRPPEKLSHKHQQLWDAQSAENVQLWTVIGQLQSAIADYKNRIMKLEAEVPCLKQAVEEPTAHVIGTAVSGPPSKRGRPKRSAASVDAVPSPDRTRPRARGRRPAQFKVQTEAKAHIFEKVVLNKVENKEQLCNPTATTQQEDENISNVITNNSGDVGVNGRNPMIPSFHSQVHQEMPGIQICGVGPNSTLEMKSNNDKSGDPNIAVAVLSRQAKGINDKGALAACLGARNNGNFEWPSAITSEDNGRNVLNTSSQGFYDNGSVVRQGGKVIPGSSFVNEQDASDELDGTLVASAKVENDEEMGDDASSGSEEIARTKGVLPQFSNW